MKIVLSTIIVLIVGNLKTPVSNNEEKKLWIIIWDYFVSFANNNNENYQLHSDNGLNITQFLTKYDYPLENHDVITEDGYILTTHRIPHGRNKKSNGKTTKPAILFAHCLSCSSMDWIWQGPNKSLPLLLADLGYDIWLANMRGNIHSMRHKSLTPNDKKFWEFSFHERGVYDLRSTIDHILNITKLEKIYFVGHSQGTSAIVALTTVHPEYNAKINLMVLLSPVIFMKHMHSPLVQFMADFETIIKLCLNLFNIHGVPYLPTLSLITDTFCNEHSSVQGLCIFLIDLFAGFDSEQVEKDKLTVFLSNTPSGFSVREVEHFIQEIRSGSFRQYDYGSVANLLHYGTSTPPDYDLSKLSAPLAIYYAKNDFLASVEDVENFLSQLKYDTFVDRYLVEYELFNHLDFVTAKDANILLYQRVIKTIRNSTFQLLNNDDNEIKYS